MPDWLPGTICLVRKDGTFIADKEFEKRFQNESLYTILEIEAERHKSMHEKRDQCKIEKPKAKPTKTSVFTKKRENSKKQKQKDFKEDIKE